SLAGRRPVRSKQSLLLVVAQRAHTDTGALGHLTDLHPHGRANQYDGAAIPWRGALTRVVGCGWSRAPPGPGHAWRMAAGGLLLQHLSWRVAWVTPWHAERARPAGRAARPTHPTAPATAG